MSMRSLPHVGFVLRSGHRLFVIQSAQEHLHTSLFSLIITMSLGPPSPTEFGWMSANTLYSEFLEGLKRDQQNHAEFDHLAFCL